MNSPILCQDPWSTLFIGTYNEARTCCAGDTILGDLNSQSLDDILNSDLAKNIRKDLVNGVWPKNCSQCEKLEKNGMRSYRNLDIDPDTLNLINQHPTDYTIQTLDVRWNNTCTLACNYCSEKFSSTWANIKKINIGTDRNYYDLALEWIDKNRASISRIMLLGGESLIIKENARLLEIFENQDIDIMLVTSLNLDLSTLVFEKLKKINRVTLDISFENVGDRYEYVRQNASWDLLIKNIKIAQDLPGFNICGTPIYNIYSATDLVNYHQFMLDYDFVTCHWNQVHWPSELDVTTHNIDVKKLALDEIYRTRDRFAGTKIYDSVFFDKMISILKSDNMPAAKNTKFDEFTHNIEQIYHPNKKHTFYELWPEFQGIIT